MRRYHIGPIITALVAATAFAGVAHAQGDQGRGRGRGQQSDDRDKRIKDEQRRTDDYRKHLDEQTRVAQQQAAQLQQSKRAAQARVQQEYAAQLDRQREQLRAERRYDNEPYVVAAPSYRYQYNGAYHETNQYGVDMLKQAVNYGYQRGYQAGVADRQDHWRFDYQNSPEYREATSAIAAATSISGTTTITSARDSAAAIRTATTAGSSMEAGRTGHSRFWRACSAEFSASATFAELWA